LATALRSRTVDVIISTGKLPWFRCEQQLLWSERILVALPEDHPLAERKIIYWTDLSGQTLLMSRHDPYREFESLITSVSDGRQPYLADIKRLSDVAADAAALDEPELVATLRSLVEVIIVHAPANSDEFTVEIRASLSELMMPGPLMKRTGPGGIDGSGGSDSRASPSPSELFFVIWRERKAA